MTLGALLRAGYTHPLATQHRYRTQGAEPDMIELRSITNDSRRADESSLFVALRGATTDGHDFLASAAERGVRAFVVEELPATCVADACYVIVPDSHQALGLLASAWWGHPSDDMTVIGVTGTNGKTTIATLLYRLMSSAGYPCGLLSTVSNYIGTTERPSTHTTPGALDLQALLAEMRDAGCSHVFMEVSSHAVDQRRIAGISFDGGIFTNLTRDHLDYHGTVKEYLYAKKRFFDELPATAFALSNADDRNGQVMLQNTSARQLTYALHSPANYRGRIETQYVDCTELECDGHRVIVQLVGEFNMYNLTAIYATAVELGIERLEALRLLSTLTSAPGRLETFTSAQRGYTAMVDYAHTPDALVNVLETIAALRAGRDSKIITVVGCGGDRDRGKRPIMAAEAARLSDRLILTADNPRSEEPSSILEEMRCGLDTEALARTLTIEDRAEAIRTACMLAGRGDYVLIAGKGHETYQEIKGIRHPFDDREVVRSIMATE